MNDNKMDIRQEDIFVITPAGTLQLQSSDTPLAAEQLELLILVDGQSTVEAITRRLRAVKPDAVERIFRDLIARGLVLRGVKQEADSLDFTRFFSVKAEPSAAAMAEAGSEASSGTTSLQKQGYYVRIARSATKKRTLAAGEKLPVIIVEDEEHLGKLLKTYLHLEGFEARVATNRAEIVAELRRAPLPQLVLLDVMLPDADGFDILAAIRRHPALSAVPVVMLTAKSTRESVLRGLAGGADGYITKPFEIDVLMKAVRSVLGLPEA